MVINRHKRIEELKELNDNARISISEAIWFLGISQTQLSKLNREAKARGEEPFLTIIDKKGVRNYTTKKYILECYDRMNGLLPKKVSEPKMVILSDMTNWENELKETANTFKEHHQIVKLFEEMSELQAELARYLLKEREVRIANIQEEIADVFIVLAQMCYFFDKDGNLKNKIDRKMEDLENKRVDCKNKQSRLPYMDSKL